MLYFDIHILFILCMHEYFIVFFKYKVHIEGIYYRYFWRDSVLQLSPLYSENERHEILLLGPWQLLTEN